MSTYVGRARSFMASNGRLLDRHRFEAVATGGLGARAAIVDCLSAYRNPDGGFGWGLEPDLRASESQPAGAQHAWEAIADAQIAAPAVAGPLLDWLQATALADGGLPFATPISDPTACAPFWVQADAGESSLQITAAITAQALRAARADPEIHRHPWLNRSIDYCFSEIQGIDIAPSAYVLSFALQLLDVASDTRPQAHDLLKHLAQFVPSHGALDVVGGAEGETLHLLDYAPEPGRPVRDLLDPAAVQADLDRLQAAQLFDGGWAVDFTSYSAAAALEWRGYATVRAVSVLLANGREGGMVRRHEEGEPTTPGP